MFDEKECISPKCENITCVPLLNEYAVTLYVDGFSNEYAKPFFELYLTIGSSLFISFGVSSLKKEFFTFIYSSIVLC